MIVLGTGEELYNIIGKSIKYNEVIILRADSHMLFDIIAFK